MKSTEFLTEAMFDVSQDANWIYENYFKEYANSIVDGTWNLELPKPIVIPSAKLKSPDAQKATAINPVNIYLYDRVVTGNEYQPLKHAIYINLGKNAIKFIQQNDGLKHALVQLSTASAKQMQTELTPARIKGSISHEISHWIDDTLHNNHLRNMINTAMHSSGKDRIKAVYQGNPDVALTSYEINAQIHAIKELKIHNESMWDVFDFDDVVDLNASLASIRNTLRKFGLYNKWKRKILQRMAREGLLGKYMSKTYG